MNLIKHGGLEGDGGLVVLFSIVVVIVTTWLLIFEYETIVAKLLNWCRALKARTYRFLYACDNWWGKQKQKQK